MFANAVRFFIGLCLGLLVLSGSGFSQDIKKADLSGSWYSDSRRELSHQINTYLERATPKNVEGKIIAIISPHAGFFYSGRTAAHGFKSVTHEKIDTVIVVGFSHRKDYDGIAVLDADGVETPLGVLYTDKELSGEIMDKHAKIFAQRNAFSSENSVELILPFIQKTFKDSKAVFLAIGKQSFDNAQILGQALYDVLKEKENVLMVASTDMSHYLPLDQAISIDNDTVEIIEMMDPLKFHQECYNVNRLCGVAAVTATMIAAKKLGADKVHILHQSTSSDSDVSMKQVVGYLSAAFVKSGVQTKKEEDVGGLLNSEQRKELLTLARDTLELYLGKGEVLKRISQDPLFKKDLGVFVTLHRQERLRGCIGHIIAIQPLYQGVIEMAIAAATQDPRFSSVSEEELKDITIEISVLSPLEKVTNTDDIIMGVHGVVVKDRFRSGVYLPQVAIDTGWSKEEFMNSLCRDKAGMEEDAWKTGETEIYIFTAEVFSE